MDISDKEYLDICRKHMITQNSIEFKTVKVRATKYGVTAKDLIILWDSQDGKCATCRTELAWIKNQTLPHGVVDHCHRSGNVRGWLCQPCNIRVGSVDRKSPKELLALLESPAVFALETKFKSFSHDQFLKLVEYVFQNADISTSLAEENQPHNRKASTFLVPTTSVVYEFKNPSDGDRSLLIRWMKNKGIQGQLFKADGLSSLEDLWIVRIDTSDDKRLAFEERFMVKSD